MHYIGSYMCQEGTRCVSIGPLPCHLHICDVREFIANRELMKRKMIVYKLGVDKLRFITVVEASGGGLI
jgi:hypothetical protein